jgi:addiction module HigA family antidote
MTSLLRNHAEIVGDLTATCLAPVHPGEVLLKEFLQPAGLSRGALARALLVHPNRVSALCQGRVRVTPELALRLARYWGTSARFWMDIQTCYDLETARDKVGAQVDAEVTPGMGAGLEIP